jgi:hypothetical protein
MKIFFVFLLIFSLNSYGQDEDEHAHHHHLTYDSDCSDEEYFDPQMVMCVPRPGEYTNKLHSMIHGNAFAVGQSSSGPRGRNALAAPHMLMIDSGTSLDTNNYLNLELMLTGERWTFPNTGNPELLQLGEENSYGQPFIDAQHPHSSPFMGITLSNTIKLPAGKNHAKIFYAPQGASTSGPIAFMHRPTGMVNPDAPLGHHLGQDSGHISNNIIGGALQLWNLRIETSAFSGTEPKPTEVGLSTFGRINSYALRLTQEFTPTFWIMGSAAIITSPEPEHISLSSRVQYSLSAYSESEIFEEQPLLNTFILGFTRDDDQSPLRSVGEEFLLPFMKSKFWGRFELIERRPEDLLVPSSDPESARWIPVLTLGFTQTLFYYGQTEFSLGTSVTHSFLPAEFANAYGGDPWTGKVFLQIMGMDAFDL